MNSRQRVKSSNNPSAGLSLTRCEPRAFLAKEIFNLQDEIMRRLYFSVLAENGQIRVKNIKPGSS